MRNFNEISKEEIIQAIEECEYLSSVLKKLDCQSNQANREKLKNFIESNNIETQFKIRLTKDTYEQNPKHCKYCGKIIPYEKRQNDFCNQSCSTSYNNIERKNKVKKEDISKGDSKKQKNIKQKKYCINCGNEITGRGEKYCCPSCQKEYEYKQWVTRWKNGEESGLKGEYGISNYLKHYLLKKFNYKCSKCGWGEENPYSHTIPLEVEHIDGNYLNNNESNLTILCPNCHSLTSTYKGANRGFGRKDRLKYYSEVAQ